MTGKPTGRGGSRPGAGRKPKSPSTEIKPAKNQTPTSRRGGSRPGAGRKPKAESAPVELVSAEAPLRRAAKERTLEPQPHGGALRREKATPVPLEGDDLLSLLQDIAFGRVDATMAQIRAATAALPFIYAKKGDSAKKDEEEAKRKAASTGRFGRREAPRLAAAGGKTV